jgi:peptidoglycan lytic transglycosylase
MLLKLCLAGGLALACAVSIGPASAQGPKRFSGTAAFYTKGYQGRVASGGHYDPSRLTAAHKTLPFGTRVRVTDKRTHRSVTVTITDRGPFNKGRVIDLSYAAAKQLHMIGRGIIRVIGEVEPRGAFTTASETSKR